jgi:hypothetical protein
VIAGCWHLGLVVFGLGGAAPAFIGTAFRSRTAWATENEFLRKQLALDRGWQVKPGRASPLTDSQQKSDYPGSRTITGWREDDRPKHLRVKAVRCRDPHVHPA